PAAGRRGPPPGPPSLGLAPRQPQPAVAHRRSNPHRGRPPAGAVTGRDLASPARAARDGRSSAPLLSRLAYVPPSSNQRGAMAETGVKGSDLAGEPVIYQPRHVGRGLFPAHRSRAAPVAATRD